MLDIKHVFSDARDWRVSHWITQVGHCSSTFYCIPSECLESVRWKEILSSMAGAHLFKKISPHSCLALHHCRVATFSD